MARRRRGAAGFTLVELMVALTISSAIVVPLMAWMLLGFRQQHEITARSEQDTGTSFLSIYLPLDVNSANAEDPVLADCTLPVVPPAAHASTTTMAGPDPSPEASPPAPAAGTPVLALRYDDNGTTASRTVYVVEDGPTGGVLVRHRCDATGLLVSTNRIASGLRAPAGGWPAIVARSARPGYSAGDVGRLTVTLTGVAGRPLAVSAELRTGGPR